MPKTQKMEQNLLLGFQMQIEDIKILIAEDEDELREYLVEYLEIFFKHVYSASCGIEAYKIYLQKRPAIILSDINMPNLDGLSMISKIRKENRDLETDIIIMSAHSDREKLLQAVELNLVTYLVKPIKTQELKEILLKQVDKIRSLTNRVNLSDNSYWDLNSAKFYHDTQEINLKDKESMLLSLLCSNLNTPFSSETIFKILYENSNKEFSEYAITSLVKRLRTKIPANILQNEYGAGYKISANG